MKDIDVQFKIKNVKMGSLNFEIIFKDKVIDEYEMEINGLMLYDSEKIEINKNLTTNIKRVILLHEIMHVILEKSGIDSSNDIAEHIITSLSNGLIDVFIEKENKKIRNFLFHADEE